MISLDPLSGHADPRLYVPLDTGERALGELAACLKQGQSPILFTGPSGAGKTLLLRVLAEREWKSFPRVRFTPLLSLPPEELSDWLLHLLFRRPSGGSPEAEDALLEGVRSLHNNPILLLVDNIQRTPAASIRKLGELAFACRPGLAVIVAGTDDRVPNALARAFAPEATVALPDLLSDAEIETLYEAIVAHPGLSPRLRYRLAGVERDDITRAAAGSPRLLKSELVRRNEPRTAAQRGLLPVERPRLMLVPEPAVSPVELVEPAEPRQVPRRDLPARPPRRTAAQRLARPIAIIGRASGRLLGLLIGTCAFVAGVPPALAAALSRSAALFRASLMAACRSAGASVASRATELNRRRRELSSSAREAVLAVHGGSMAIVRSANDAVVCAGVGLREDARARAARVSIAINTQVRHGQAAAQRGRVELSRSLQEAGGRVRRRVAGAHADAVRARNGISTAVQEAMRYGGVVLASAWQGAFRVASVAAVPATALLALALFSLGDYGLGRQPSLTAAALAQSDVATPTTSLTPTAGTAGSQPVNLQVNARPWARVRINGVDVGPTPLSQRLAPGTYRLEAEFPSGERIQRKIDIGQKTRFVALP